MAIHTVSGDLFVNRYGAQALQAMRTQADQEQVRSIALPRIGAGYGGLSWRKVRAIIEQVFATWNGDLYVYDAYQAEEQTV